jgi:4-alpha-glucanotransferase
MIRGGMASQSRLCIVQIQDYLQLGAEARMNHPGTQSEYNWAWRAKAGMFTPELAERIAKLTQDTGRA